MQSIKELYKIGRGPSSSHTLAPERACKLFNESYGAFPYYEAELFGSLSLTGKGHHTDAIIEQTLLGEVKVIFSLEWEEEFPNGFYIRAYNDKHELQQRWTVFSIGGGSIRIVEKDLDWNDEVYQENTLKEIKQVLQDKNESLLSYIYSYEPNLRQHLSDIVDAEVECVHAGITAEAGVLPGKLKLQRVARKLYLESLENNCSYANDLKLMSYAYAAGEENADTHKVVTAPTLGACGVIAALTYHCIHDLKIDKDTMIDALAIGGIFGNLIKHNATISGAVGGCQAEVGSAVSMASAAFAYILGGNLNDIEYAAEIGIEHHLGLTCDPVMGYVLIPCIERNSQGILRAIDAANLAIHMNKVRATHKVSFDTIVETMKETGNCIPMSLKETSIGGLAKYFDESQC